MTTGLKIHTVIPFTPLLAIPLPFYTKRMAKAIQMEKQIKSLHRKYKMTPKNVRKIMTATIQSSALFGAEIWWRNQVGRIEKIQVMLNRQARAITGCMKSTPIGPLTAEAYMIPATITLTNRQRRYAKRIAGLPSDHSVLQVIPDGILNFDADPADNEYRPTSTKNKPSSLGICLGNHLKPNINPRYGVEPIERTNDTVKGAVNIKNRQIATATATEASAQPGNIFTDCSRLESGYDGCSMVWKTAAGEWKRHRYHLGHRKGIFDAELFALSEALEQANRHLIGINHTVRIFSDSAPALNRIQTSEPGAGQWIVNQIAHRESILLEAGWQVEYHWVPGHADIDGNEQADKAAKEAAAFPVDRGIGVSEE